VLLGCGFYISNDPSGVPSAHNMSEKFASAGVIVVLRIDKDAL